MKNPDRPGDIDSFFETMEPDLKQIIAGHPVVTEDGHCCDFIFQLFKTYMLENSPINNRPRWELYGHGDHWQDFASWFRSMLSRYLKRKPPKGWKKRLEQAALVERRHKRG
jgi:Fe-S oxidoreductase